MNIKTNISNYKLIIYKFDKSTGLDFDIYDVVDFQGESVEDPDIVSKDENIPTDTDMVNYINDLNKKIKETWSNTSAVDSNLPSGYFPHPAIVDPNSRAVKEFFEQNLRDEESSYLKDKNYLSINWKKIPTILKDYKGTPTGIAQYIENKKSIFKDFFYKSLYDLIEGNYVIERDITDAVISVGTHRVDGEKIENTIEFNLDFSKIDKNFQYMQENYIVDFYADFVDEKEFNNIYGSYYGPSTKDELGEILSEINLPSNSIKQYFHTRRFIGFISHIEYDFVPGEIPIIKIKCDGIGKILERCNVTKNRAVYTHFESQPFAVNQPGYTIYSDNLNNKSVDEIFSYVLNGTLDISENTMYTYLNNPKFLDDIKEDERLKEVRGLTFTDTIDKHKEYGNVIQGLSLFLRRSYKDFEKNFKDFTSWSLVTFLYFKVKEKYKEKLYEKKETLNSFVPYKKYYFSDIAAIQEANNYCVRAYNLQIKKAHMSFYSEFSSGKSIFQEICQYTYHDIFEEGDGVLTCRPSRANTFFNNDENFKINKEDIIKMSFSRNDTGLLSRVDYSPIIPLKGQFIPFAFNYVNPQILIKYGLNIPGRIETNPNVNQPGFTPHYGAVSLEWRNIVNRSGTVTVYGDREYCLGRIYFIPDLYNDDLGYIGRLTHIDTNYNIGDKIVDKVLYFNFIRRARFLNETQI